jgi:hypothetical protein
VKGGGNEQFNNSSTVSKQAEGNSKEEWRVTTTVLVKIKNKAVGG